MPPESRASSRSSAPTTDVLPVPAFPVRTASRRVVTASRAHDLLFERLAVARIVAVDVASGLHDRSLDQRFPVRVERRQGLRSSGSEHLREPLLAIGQLDELQAVKRFGQRLRPERDPRPPSALRAPRRSNPSRR